MASSPAAFCTASLLPEDYLSRMVETAAAINVIKKKKRDILESTHGRDMERLPFVSADPVSSKQHSFG